MTSTSKRLKRMRDNPAADWTIADVVALCREFGILCEKLRGARTSRSRIRPS